ncbi:hypothetical protein AB0B10_15970 [Micromonospora arborensis]|uniref:hypothetical protein n=1 Tax=Micromonospora arborensis TaxID=2116518 RepID=UPI0033C479CD
MVTGGLAMSRDIDGGRIAARGLRYQYLRTVEAMLDVLDSDIITAVRIEGPHGAHQVNAVDFDMVNSDGRVQLAAQVKSVGPGGTVSAAAAFGQLLPLVVDHDAVHYQLLTNANPDPGAQKLAALLASPGTPDQLRAGLTALLANAPARREQLAALDDQQLQRLSRARVLFDLRDIGELRETLRERIRTYRNRQREGLGAQSAGMLTRALTAEVFDRAVEADQSVFTMIRFRELLLVDGTVLALATGARDWGVVVGAIPPIPDVARLDRLEPLVAALQQASRRQPARAVLTGPSGIGKSSLAAAYLADRADTYDVIFWIDGETPFTLLAAFRQIAAYLRTGSPDGPSSAVQDAVRAEVHTALSRFPGRWALIIDNVSDPRFAQSWIPATGDGHVILTAVDATARYRSATVLDVGAMTAEQATTLLARRLGLPPADRLTVEDRATLLRLAEALGNYPLALELAAGYLDSLGLSLADTDVYLERLKIRSLADEQSIPADYPRTLIGAVSLCLDRLRSRADSNNGEAALLAIGMISFAAYLASRQLPVHLLAAAVMIDPDSTDRAMGPLLLDPSEFPVNEATRELRRYSLVAYDADLPQESDLMKIGSGRTITVNSVIQDVLRASLPFHDGSADAFDQLANHVERWHTAAAELNLLHRAAVLFSHADTLAHHLLRVGIGSERIALLVGNLAAAYRTRGDTATAEDLLRIEIDILRHASRPNELLIVQAELTLVQFAVYDNNTAPIDTSRLTAYLEHALTFASRIAEESRDAAVRLLYQATKLLETPRLLATHHVGLHQIKNACDDLLAQLGPSEYTRALDAVLTSNDAMSSGHPDRAEQICRDLLNQNMLTGHGELSARRLLIEALAAQRDWDEATIEFAQLRAAFGPSAMHHDIVSDLVHNAGMHCALSILTGTDEAPVTLLTELTAWPTVHTAMDYVTPEYQARLRLLTAIKDLACGDDEAVETFLRSYTPAALSDTPELHGWLMIWQQLRIASVRLN